MNPAALFFQAALLIAAALVTAPAILLIVKVMTNQGALRTARSHFMAHALEALLYRHDPALNTTATRALFSAFRGYARHIAPPMICAMGVLTLMAHFLTPLLAPAILRSGECAIVKATLQPKKIDAAEPVLSVSSNVAVETPSLRIPSRREFNWRIRLMPKSIGTAWIGVQVNETSIRRHVPTDDMSLGTLIEQAFPPAAGSIQRIDIIPTARQGGHADGLAIRLAFYFIITAILVEALKRPMRVET